MSRTATSRAVTVTFAFLAAGLAAVLIMVLTHRPGNDVDRFAPGPTMANSVPAAAGSPAAEADPGVDAESGSLPFSEVNAHDASPGATPHSQTEVVRRQWQPVAIGFGRAFTRTHDKHSAEWRSSLAPFVTEAVRDQLATVALDNVPVGDFAGLEVAEYGEDKVAVYLRYDTGLTLVGYLSDDGGRWRLYAYDYWQD